MGGDSEALGRMVATLAGALERAVVAAYAEADVPSPFVLQVRAEHHRLPPVLRIGGVAFRDRMRELSPEPEAAVRLLYKATPPEGVSVPLADHLDEDGQRICRHLQQLDGELGRGERDDLHKALYLLSQALCERLNARPWDGVAEPFLALVDFATPYEIDGYSMAANVLGDEHVAAFRASLSASAASPGGSSGASSPGLPDAARTDTGALVDVLRERGLGDDAERVVEKQARTGLRLVAGPDARSRLGGRALLPSGMAWPHAAGDRPLSFLAGIDLAELPERGLLPDEGWMLFWADLDNDDAEGLVDAAGNDEDAQARLVYVAPGVALVEADPPHEWVDLLADRRVRAVAQLTLPDGYDAGERLGLDPVLASVYDDVAADLAGGFGHWMLGAVTGVQGEEPEPDTELLLHMSWDEDLGFEFLDGGAVQFRIPVAALAAGDWTAVCAFADS